MQLEWIRDYDWDHYRSMGRGTHYETSSADGGWSVAMTIPGFVPLGRAATLDEVQAIAQRFEEKPLWLKKWHAHRYARLKLKRQSQPTDCSHLVRHVRRGFWARLWYGRGTVTD